jgi:hypothetical protein
LRSDVDEKSDAGDNGRRDYVIWPTSILPPNFTSTTAGHHELPSVNIPAPDVAYLARPFHALQIIDLGIQCAPQVLAVDVFNQPRVSAVRFLGTCAS